MLEFPACAKRLMFVYVVGVQTLPTSPDGDGGGSGGDGRGGGGGGGGQKYGVLVDEASGKYISVSVAAIVAVSVRCVVGACIRKTTTRARMSG